jgi:protein SCO1/2
MGVAVFATTSMVEDVHSQLGVDNILVNEVGVSEKLGAKLPLDLRFRDQSGVSKPLAAYFDGERPVVLTLNYANCPQLCSLQLDGFVDTLNKLEDWQVGNQFQVITISLDPQETDEMAQRFRERVLADYNAESAASGWHFLRGTEQDVRAIADAVGFNYNYIERKDEYAHTAVLTLLDPKAQVARYLYGIEYPPSTLRLSMAETASSKFVSTVDALILRCFSYDAASGTFVANAWLITKVVMSLIAVLLIAFLAWLHFQSRDKSTKPVA